MEELRLCPFCGGRAVMHVDEGVCVICGDCGCRTLRLADSMIQGKPMGGAIEKVVDKWNRRQ